MWQTSGSTELEMVQDIQSMDTDRYQNSHEYFQIK